MINNKRLATNKNINQFIQLTKSYFRTYLGIAISIFLFILFFQPFTTDKFENRLFFLSGFGVIVLIFFIILQVLFQRTLLRKEEDNNSNSVSIPLYCFFQIAATSLAFVFYIRFVGQVSITFDAVVRVVFICLSFPVAHIINFKLNAYQVKLKKYLLETRLLQIKLKQFSESLRINI